MANVRWARLIVWEGPEENLDYEDSSGRRTGQKTNSWLKKDTNANPKPAAGGYMHCVVLTDEELQRIGNELSWDWLGGPTFKLT